MRFFRPLCFGCEDFPDMPPRRQHGAVPLSERHTCPPPHGPARATNRVMGSRGEGPRRRPSMCNFKTSQPRGLLGAVQGHVWDDGVDKRRVEAGRCCITANKRCRTTFKRAVLLDFLRQIVVGGFDVASCLMRGVFLLEEHRRGATALEMVAPDWHKYRAGLGGV